MTPARFRAFGVALFGEHWRVPMADALGLDEHTIRRYRDGQREIPEWIECSLRSGAEFRIGELKDLIARVPPDVQSLPAQAS